MRAWQPQGFGKRTSNGRKVTLPGVRPFRFLTHEDRPDIYISETIRTQGTWEPLETELICRLIRHFTIFIDLGANIGWYTAVAQRIAKSNVNIFSFEPDADNFALLKRNSSKLWPWPKTTIVQTAISDRVGTVDLHLSSSNQGDHRIFPSELNRPYVTVPVTTLDTFFENAQLPPFLMKCDTQGSEPRILRGGKRVLSPNLVLSALILEFWPQGIVESGENIEAYIEDLVKLPHKPFLLDHGEGKLRPFAWEMLVVRCKHDLELNTGNAVDLALLPPGFERHDDMRDLIV